MVSVPLATTERRRLLIATNNRFWRGSIGSNARVAAVHQHFVHSHWDVTVAFSGRPYGADEADIARDGARVFFSQPDVGTATHDGASGLVKRSWKVRIKHAVRHAQQWLRAVLTQPHRMGVRLRWRDVCREVSLRAQELRVADGVDARYLQLVQTLAHKSSPHAVLIEYVTLAWLLPRLKPQLAADTVWLIDTHDVMYERQQRFHALGELHHLDITAREEARWLSCFDAVLAIQPRDTEKFRAIGVRARLLTVMHPHPAAAVPHVGAGPVGVGFVGSAMAPNALALKELLGEIWPRVRLAVGTQARLVVAGGVCDSVMQRDWPADVERMGYVADLDDFYRAVDIIISPLRIGGGLKIKNVEALCKGKALLTTSIGGEGLDVGLVAPFLLAEQPADLASRVVELVNDPQTRSALGAAALAHALECFSEQAVYAELDAFLAAAGTAAN